MRENLDNVMLWIQRLQKSNKQVEFPIELQANVLFTVENAMQYDFNLMIEDFQLYGMITPKMQNELIDQCFEDFIERFEPFLKECELGFRNELIVNMYIRRINVGT